MVPASSSFGLGGNFNCRAFSRAMDLREEFAVVVPRAIAAFVTTPVEFTLIST
jgi:hypothetical protein